LFLKIISLSIKVLPTQKAEAGPALSKNSYESFSLKNFNAFCQASLAEASS
jgi:hypothetical protein